MDKLITSYFSKANSKSNTKPSKRKRKTSYDKGTQATRSVSSAKRSKSDTPTAPNSAPQSSLGTTHRDAIVIDESETIARPSCTNESKQQGPSTRTQTPISISNSISQRKSLRLNTNPLILDGGYLPPDSPLTPLPPEYEYDFPPLQTGTSTSQGTARHPPPMSISPPNAVAFAESPGRNACRSTLLDSDDDQPFGESNLIGSSQSQYLSPTKTNSRNLLKCRTMSLPEGDVVESSQTQEQELYFHQWPDPPVSMLRLTSETPEPTAPGESLPFKKEPVQDVASQPPSSIPTEESLGSPLPEEAMEQNQWSPSSYGHFWQQPEIFSYRSPSPTMTPDNELKIPNIQHDSQELPHNSLESSQPYGGEEVSPTQDSMYSIPPELQNFDMFEGDESYPPDFPMSLRV